MEFFTKFPVMERSALAEFRKSIDFAFRDFSRAYGDGIESFFDPLLYFLVWLEKLMINSPWPIIIAIICGLAWIASKSWKNFGAIIISKSLMSAFELINQIAPEHLELAIKSPHKYIKNIKNAGAIFLGRYTPEAIGDYVAGPNHVLPTDRTARFSSGLNLLDFFKRTSVVSCNKKNLNIIGKDAIKLAYEEGLQAHALSIECRIKNN